MITEAVLEPAPPVVPHLRLSDTELAFRYRSDFELQKAHLLFTTIQSNWLVKAGTPLLEFALHIGLPVRGLVREYFFNQFCGGTNLGEVRGTVLRLARYNVKSILDFAVEAQASEGAFNRTADEVVRSIQFARSMPQIPFIAVKATGLGPSEVLEKAGKGELTPTQQQAYDRLYDRLNRICQTARDSDQAIFIDAEESWLQDGIDKLAEELMIKYNRDRAVVYTTAQMYRHDRLEYVKKLFQKIRFRKAIPGVKLVRGAYLEKENRRARQLGYPTPMQPTKQQTDSDFNKALAFIIERLDTYGVCVGTHNEVSSELMVRLMVEKGHRLDHPNLCASQLYGMSDHITFALAEVGVNVAKYLPYGTIESVLPYLFRRAQENTSIAGQTSRELELVRKEIQRRKQRGSTRKPVL